MTTVGYGDKAPVTFWGRSLAIVWMFASVITISGFTATIASVFTLQQIKGYIKGPNDLPGHTVAVVTGSTGESYAKSVGLHYVGFESPLQALEALSVQKVKACVYDVSVLRYLAEKQYAEQIAVLPGQFQRQDYAFGLSSGSLLREPINRALLSYINSPQWQYELTQYLGD